MKLRLTIIIVSVVILSLITPLLIPFSYIYKNNKELNSVSKITYKKNNELTTTFIEEAITLVEDEYKEDTKIVYKNLNKKELVAKINRSLNSTISGKGELIATYSLEKGVDPYLAVAIILLETGCTWECSRLVKQCNNVGGQKGSPSCNGGSYAKFDTLDNGIRAYINNLSKNYINKGLTTPETMNRKYAASPTWAEKVNRYINKIEKA